MTILSFSLVLLSLPCLLYVDLCFLMKDKREEFLTAYYNSQGDSVRFPVEKFTLSNDPYTFSKRTILVGFITPLQIIRCWLLVRIILLKSKSALKEIEF